jgi:drug/metabolite transporter (DMT)-like permease
MSEKIRIGVVGPGFMGRSIARLTFFHNFLSLILFFKALKVLDAMEVTLANYLITCIGLPVAAIWPGEKLNASAIVGGIMVLVSTLIITIVDYRVIIQR